MKRNFVMVVVLSAMLLTQSAVAEIKTIPGKPTYEETIAFIKSQYSSGTEFKALYENSYVTVEVQKIIKVYFNIDCIMEAKYQIQKTFLYPNGHREKFVDLIVSKDKDFRDVEGIAVLGNGGKGKGDTWIYGLLFVEKNQKIEQPWDLPVAVKNGSGVVREIKEYKIYKAFNHLRNLCGAPEPLEF